MTDEVRPAAVPVAILAADVPSRARLSVYPEPFAARMRGRDKKALGQLFGLRNFGVNLTRLAPGAISALRHAHARQDEFIYILQGHPILRTQPLTLEAIARHPIITYDFAFTGRNQINKAFLGRGLKPKVVLTAIDSDVIKKYVEMDLGIGILARMAYDPAEDRRLGMVDAAHLFESSTTRIGLRRRAWLRAYVYAFIEGFAPHLSRRMVETALAGGGTDPGL